MISPFRPEGKIFQVQKESQEWAEKMDISYVGDLNDHITKEGISNILLVQEHFRKPRFLILHRELSWKAIRSLL